MFCDIMQLNIPSDLKEIYQFFSLNIKAERTVDGFGITDLNGNRNESKRDENPSEYSLHYHTEYDRHYRSNNRYKLSLCGLELLKAPHRVLTHKMNSMLFNFLLVGDTNEKYGKQE